MIYKVEHTGIYVNKKAQAAKSQW